MKIYQKTDRKRYGLEKNIRKGGSKPKEEGKMWNINACDRNFLQQLRKHLNILNISSSTSLLLKLSGATPCPASSSNMST